MAATMAVSRCTAEQRPHLEVAFARHAASFAATPRAEKLAPLEAHVVRLWEAGRPFPVGVDRAALARAFATASLIYACVTKRASTIGQARLVATLDGEELPATDLLGEIAASPNPETTQAEYLGRIESDLVVYGNWIAQLRRSAAGIIRQVWPLRVDRQEVVVAKGGEPTKYGGRAERGEVWRYEQWIDGQMFSWLWPEDVCHLKLYNPESDYWGLSPLVPLRRERLIDGYTSEFLRSFFENGGLPSAVLSTQIENLTGKQALEIAARWKETTGLRYGVGGGTGWNEPFVLGSGATVQELGGDLSKLDLSVISEQIQAAVCSAIGIPANIAGAPVGLKQSQAYGSLAQSGEDWWEQDLAPRADWIGQALTLRIAQEFGRGCALTLSLEHIEAYRKAFSKLLTGASMAFSSGLFSRARALRWAGQKPDPGDEKVYARGGPVTQPFVADPGSGRDAGPKRLTAVSA